MTYLEQSQLVQKFLTSEQINELWNQTGFGNLAKITTTNRWLNNGPRTKNPKFEPWLCTLASVIITLGGIKRTATISIDDKIKALVNQKRDLSNRELATVKSIQVFKEYAGELSGSQQQIINKLYNNRINN